MRSVVAFAGAFLVASCAPLQPGEVVAYGAIWTVSRDDIRQAVAAARAGDTENRATPILEVKVRGSSEMQVWFGHSGPSDMGTRAIVRRVNGRWRYITTEEIIITS